MKKPLPPTGDDPQWYKDAIIYQLHIKSFFDSNDDGIGDFPGLISKLDYIAGLGATAIWLLPFYPSPGRDDGYDISDYRNVHPNYGTMADVRAFIHAAHERKIRVITELVINHTSDQHPWFQRARKAKPGSVYRDFYVWSETDKKYDQTRIIFLDTEKSNWTWDEEAGAFYWHRFYSHQPDLNFDNPRVRHEVLKIMRFWLDLGVDGLRLDAVPYLIEREGTNNENLPETHAVLKEIRAALDAHAPGRMLLAEANQWPEDAQQYFGNGDECHMAFHFPLMPRMYMAIAQEDRYPITDIMRQTPEIPPNCQWAVFLRNHDELTLEMVTDSERDYLWNTYAMDPRARLNLGIRRRLAPLMDRDRRRIELMTSLLLSMPGTPVLYYGDEIGMGDNIHLGDRDGVRTPMQWSADRNGGFSRANPAQLVLPPIMDALYGYQAVNVEMQMADQYSLLNWNRRMLAVRKRHRAFGRGTQKFLYPGNRKILAYLRRFKNEDGQEEIILCVSNLSRNAQAVELDLSEFEGRVPVDLIGTSGFPAIGQLTYLLTLPPFAFYWFILANEEALPPWHVKPSVPLPELLTLVIRKGIQDVAQPPDRALLETDILPSYLARRRWFGAKDRSIDSVTLTRTQPVAELPGFLVTGLEVRFGDDVEYYNLPLGICWDGETNAPLPAQLALGRVRQGRRTGYLTDAFAMDAFAFGIVRGLQNNAIAKLPEGELRFIAEAPLSEIKLSDNPEIRRLSAEQSNSSLIVDRKVILKLIRHYYAGVNPEIEMTRYLTQNGYKNTPALLGEVAEWKNDETSCSLMVAQQFRENQGDAWQVTLNYLSRLIDMGGMEGRDEAEDAHQLSNYRSFARAVGTRLAELHVVLAKPTDNPDFAPDKVSAEDARNWGDMSVSQFRKAVDILQNTKEFSDRETGDRAQRLLSAAERIQALLPKLAAAAQGTLATRIHGDFHLGQVLVSSDDVFIIDFEGEPAKPLPERRRKSSPLRDVAGLLRSFDYAAAAAQHGPVTPEKEQSTSVVSRFVDNMHDEFLRSYMEVIKAHYAVALEPKAMEDLLTLFLIEKAAYEICYEAANRPSWLGIPLKGIEALITQTMNRELQNAR